MLVAGRVCGGPARKEADMGFQCRPHVARRQDAAAVTAARKAREGSVAAVDRDGTAYQLRAAERHRMEVATARRRPVQIPGSWTV